MMKHWRLITLLAVNALLALTLNAAPAVASGSCDYPHACYEGFSYGGTFGHSRFNDEGPSTYMVDPSTDVSHGDEAGACFNEEFGATHDHVCCAPE